VWPHCMRMSDGADEKYDHVGYFVATIPSREEQPCLAKDVRNALNRHHWKNFDELELELSSESKMGFQTIRTPCKIFWKERSRKNYTKNTPIHIDDANICLTCPTGLTRKIESERSFSSSSSPSSSSSIIELFKKRRNIDMGADMSGTAVLCIRSTRKVCRIRYWQARNREVTIDFVQYKVRIPLGVNIADPIDCKNRQIRKRKFSDEDDSMGVKVCRHSTDKLQDDQGGCDTKSFQVGECPVQKGGLLMDLLDPLTYMPAIEHSTPESLASEMIIAMWNEPETG